MIKNVVFLLQLKEIYTLIYTFQTYELLNCSHDYMSLASDG